MPVLKGSDTEHERHNDADEGERLTEGEAQDLVGADQTGGLGLAGEGLGAVTEDDADADAGAVGGETLADGTEGTVDGVGGEGLESGHAGSSFSFMDRWGLATGRLGV